MHIVTINNIEADTDRVRLLKAILRYANIDLSEAKHLVNDLVDEKSVTVSFKNRVAADSFVEEATPLGATLLLNPPSMRP